jgi:hypothetical protein
MMRAVRALRISLAAAALTVLLAPSISRADDRATATALFDEGMTLMRSGRVNEACRKLEASERLYQGLGTRANLGECYEKTNRLASSWSMYRGALSMAETKGDARADELRRRVAAVEAHLSRVTVEVSAATKVPGLRIMRGESEIPDASWGVAVPIDGGRYTFSAMAPGFRKWSSDVEIKAENDAVVVSVPALEHEDGGLPPTPSPTILVREGASSKSLDVDAAGQAPRGAGMRYGGIGMMGLGVIGLGAGGVFGLKAMSKKSSASNVCSGADCRTPQGVDDMNDAIAAAKASTILFSAGAAVVAGGVVLYLLAPSSTSTSATAASLCVDASFTSSSKSLSLWGTW